MNAPSIFGEHSRTRYALRQAVSRRVALAVDAFVRDRDAEADAFLREAIPDAEAFAVLARCKCERCESERRFAAVMFGGAAMIGALAYVRLTHGKQNRRASEKP